MFLILKPRILSLPLSPLTCILLVKGSIPTEPRFLLAFLYRGNSLLSPLYPITLKGLPGSQGPPLSESPCRAQQAPPPAFHTHSGLRASSSMNGLPPRYPTFPPNVQGPEWLWSREYSRSTVDTGQSFILCIPTLLEGHPCAV